jgi:hypothetical protein
MSGGLVRDRMSDLPGGYGEYIMRNKVAVSLLTVVLLSLAVLLTGCGLFNQPGKTPAEVNREHARMLRINQQQMMADIDRTLDLDRPSRLTDKRLP